MRPNPRDRITIEFKGLRDHLHAVATTRGVSAAALVRQALMALLEEEHGDELAEHNTPDRRTVARDEAPIKVTVRLPVAHALLLAQRARAADVAQGTYLARLMEGTPPVPRPAHHGEAVTALMRSTDQLATTGADLHAFMRWLGRASAPELEPYRASVKALTEHVSKHLVIAAPLVAELKTARRPR
jgi:hypothetical protein